MSLFASFLLLARVSFFYSFLLWITFVHFVPLFLLLISVHTILTPLFLRCQLKLLFLSASHMTLLIINNLISYYCWKKSWIKTSSQFVQNNLTMKWKVLWSIQRRDWKGITTKKLCVCVFFTAVSSCMTWMKSEEKSLIEVGWGFRWTLPVDLQHVLFILILQAKEHCMSVS